MREAMAGVFALAIAGAPVEFPKVPFPRLNGLYFEWRLDQLIERNKREKLEGPFKYPAGRRSVRSRV